MGEEKEKEKENENRGRKEEDEEKEEEEKGGELRRGVKGGDYDLLCVGYLRHLHN